MTPDAPSLAPLLRGFFLDRLIRQRNASPATVAAYRDSFRLLLRFAEKHLHRSAASFTTDDLGAPLILAFLDHLERERGNTIRTRNARLAAVHSFVTYAGREEPAALAQIQRVLAIPSKRCARAVLGYLSRDEVRAVLAAPNVSTWSGRRDHVLFATLYNTGARVSEAIGLDVGQLHLDRTPRVCLRGKGRKERTVPLWKSTARALVTWIRDQRAPPDAPLFPNRHGRRMTRSGVARRLARAVATAASSCPLLKGRRISPHTLRHTTAMHLLEAGNDISLIALWLGHESPATTHGYLEANITLKERVLSRVAAPAGRRNKRFRASDSLLAFLDGL
jgi:site-specific recombinase XerD